MNDLAINNIDVYDIAEIKKRLTPIFKNNRVKRSVLFGSYTKGEASSRSDVDILVASELWGLRFIGIKRSVYVEHYRRISIYNNNFQ